MPKSTLTEIDRLEGIAQAYRRRRPIVPMTGVITDCHGARWLVGLVEHWTAAQDDALEQLGEAKEQLADAQLAFDSATSEIVAAQTDLDNLMASLSARLER